MCPVGRAPPGGERSAGRASGRFRKRAAAPAVGHVGQGGMRSERRPSPGGACGPRSGRECSRAGPVRSTRAFPGDRCRPQVHAVTAFSRVVATAVADAVALGEVPSTRTYSGPASRRARLGPGARRAREIGDLVDVGVGRADAVPEASRALTAARRGPGRCQSRKPAVICAMGCPWPEARGVSCLRRYTTAPRPKGSLVAHEAPATWHGRQSSEPGKAPSQPGLTG